MIVLTIMLMMVMMMVMILMMMITKIMIMMMMMMTCLGASPINGNCNSVERAANYVSSSPSK